LISTARQMLLQLRIRRIGVRGFDFLGASVMVSVHRNRNLCQHTNQYQWVGNNLHFSESWLILTGIIIFPRRSYLTIWKVRPLSKLPINVISEIQSMSRQNSGIKGRGRRIERHRHHPTDPFLPSIWSLHHNEPFAIPSGV
jgi:hypothetical protein